MTYRIIEGGVARDMNEVEAAEQEALMTAAAAEAVTRHEANRRAERNALLAESDWVVVKATEAGESVPSAWSTYRTALRDITSDADWPDMDWPTKPE